MEAEKEKVANSTSPAEASFSIVFVYFIHSQFIGPFRFIWFMNTNAHVASKWWLRRVFPFFSFRKKTKKFILYFWKTRSFAVVALIFRLLHSCCCYVSFHFFAQIRFLSVFVPCSFHSVLRVHMTNFLPHSYCRYASHTTCTLVAVFPVRCKIFFLRFNFFVSQH